MAMYGTTTLILPALAPQHVHSHRAEDTGRASKGVPVRFLRTRGLAVPGYSRAMNNGRTVRTSKAGISCRRALTPRRCPRKAGVAVLRGFHIGQRKPNWIAKPLFCGSGVGVRCCLPSIGRCHARQAQKGGRAGLPRCRFNSCLPQCSCSTADERWLQTMCPGAL